MDPIKLRLQYEGLDKHENSLPAHLGAKSIEALLGLYRLWEII